MTDRHRGETGTIDLTRRSWEPVSMSIIDEDKLLENGLLIITGSTPRAEQADRPLAYDLKGKIDALFGKRDIECNVVVMGDLWYLNSEPLQKLPMISIGGPGVNAVSAHLYNKLQNYLVIDDTLLIQMDPGLKDLRVSIWGMNHETTVSALEMFVNNKCLERFMDAVIRRCL